MLNDMDMMKKWSKYKAMEACYGEDITKTQLLKMKRAIAKCSKIDMPELDLPMFNTPYRAIQALLNGASEMEKTNMYRFQEVMKTMGATAAGSTGGLGQFQQSKPQYIPVPIPQSEAKESKPDVVEELMKKMFMRKVMAKFFGDANEDDDNDDQDTDDFFGVEDDEKFAEMLFFSKNKNNRNRFSRAAGTNEDVRIGPHHIMKRQSDLYELGDRLSEKLMEQKEETMEKMGNWTCVLRELRMVDKNMELDLEAMLDNIKDMNIRDPWLLEQTIEDCRTCYAYAQNLPRRLFDQMTLPEQWVKVKMFKKCSKMAKYQTCMDNDIKKKLEENFGPLQKLVETTGLAEKELLPMAMRLLHGDMDIV
jgi:hypothetical protein